jgi:hypothetical protein
MAALAALLGLCGEQSVLAQGEAPPASKNENFSAKPPAQLFASDCTGAGCHKGPQGLAKGQSQGSLAGFLREHYTNSRESAAAIAGYLSKLPSGPEPKDARTPRGRSGPSEAAAGGPGRGGPGEPKPEAKPKPAKPAVNEARTPPQHPAARASRAAARPEEETPEALPKPAPNVRGKRGRQPVTAAAPPPPAPEPAPAPAAPPPPKQYDIFD